MLACEDPGRGAGEPMKTIVLLVDDQQIIAEAVSQMFAGEADIELHHCGDPTRAIDTALEVRPTVILQDLVMPEIDGLTLVRFFRAHPETREIPLIVLSTKEEPTVKAEAFTVGANDYVVKLPDKLELCARVRYHSRGYVALKQRNAAFSALAKELAEAAAYVRSLLPLEQDEGPPVRWRYIPSAQLGGDVFGYHWIDEEHFAAYLFDVCGHGVGASLLGVSLLNLMRSPSLQRETDLLDPAAVLTMLNRVFPMESNNNMFFSGWYGVMQRRQRVLRFASGGHPPAALVHGVDRETATLERLISPGGFLIGAMPDSRYDNIEVSLAPQASLFVFSDGVYEVTRADSGEMWQLDDWLAALVANAREAEVDLDALVELVRRTQGREGFDDDFSLFQVDLSRE